MRHERTFLPLTFGFLLLAICFAAFAFSSTADTRQTPSAAQVSHVRVVRLSFTEGTVTVRTPGSAEWSNAMLNSPIQEEYAIATGKRSFAEVQFENGSTVRVGELSLIDFTQLSLSPEGGHTNRLSVERGYATFNVVPEHHDEYLVSISGVSLAPRGKADFRTDLAQDRLRVEVFDGRVEARDSDHTETLSKNHAMVRDLSPGASFRATGAIQKDEWDKWTEARQQQSTLAVNEGSFALPSPRYGWDDLDVYGEWTNLPGYGIGWAPYEPVGWSPYSLGMWDWDSGMGYTWISGEPWGWLPFHYGFWNFDPALGWFWMPGAFGAWSPALVNWYSGPGWIGWTPIGAAGVGGSAPCTLATAGCLTAVPPRVLRGREPSRPGDANVVHPTSIAGITAIARPGFEPDRPTTHQSSAGVVAQPADRNGELAPGNEAHNPANATSASAFTRGRGGAPSSIVMGEEVSPEVFLADHSRHRGAAGREEAVRVQLGSTIGGHFPTGLTARRGFDRAHGAESFGSQPQFLYRNSSRGRSSGSAAGLGERGGAPSG
ncbi:MAG: FecR family protein, partial [Candidatus Korobacteraceae bacterium]